MLHEVREGFIRHRLLPQVIAFVYYHISWLLYVVRPRGSYLLNAWFEDHAEREYMRYVAENPALESEPFESIFADDYGHFASLADLFRQIGYDERVHKLESLERTRIHELKRVGMFELPVRRLRYAGVIGGTEVEVRGPGSVIVSESDARNELVINTGEAVVVIRVPAELLRKASERKKR